MNIKRTLYLILGLVGLGLGAIGAVVPLLPAFPFLLIAAFGFARSSARLNNWFPETKLYKENLKSFREKKGMPWKAKIRIMILVTATMTIGFLMMSRVPIGRMILFFVWIFHIGYFTFIVKTPAQVSKIEGEIEKNV